MCVHLKIYILSEHLYISHEFHVNSCEFILNLLNLNEIHMNSHEFHMIHVCSPEHFGGV